jgi:hypothetical protein
LRIFKIPILIYIPDDKDEITNIIYYLFIFNLVNLNKYKKDINRRNKGILK